MFKIIGIDLGNNKPKAEGTESKSSQNPEGNRTTHL